MVSEHNLRAQEGLKSAPTNNSLISELITFDYMCANDTK